ncbi:MAG: Fe-S cluster protein [Desulfohalobiaceae bacterium]|nr:Fe-S cluster protein [Desulfohalobiaceae bacterium]
MLLEGYTKEIFRSKCNTQAQSLHCFAHLDQDISEVIPYLNAELEGDAFTREPPSVTFKAHGKLITVHPDKIAINALQDEEEADKICGWLQREINAIWERRDQIEPKYAVRTRPQIFPVLKLLPTSAKCSRECGQPTCMVLAKLICEGAVSPEACLHLSKDNLENIQEYLAGFDLDV